MPAIRVQIVGWVDDHQPGFVECRFTDQYGCERTIIEKLPIVTGALLNERSTYPQPGSIPCRIVTRTRDESEREIVEVDTTTPIFIEAVDGETRFHLFIDDLIEA